MRGFGRTRRLAVAALLCLPFAAPVALAPPAAGTVDTDVDTDVDDDDGLDTPEGQHVRDPDEIAPPNAQPRAHDEIPFPDAQPRAHDEIPFPDAEPPDPDAP